MSDIWQIVEDQPTKNESNTSDLSKKEEKPDLNEQNIKIVSLTFEKKNEKGESENSQSSNSSEITSSEDTSSSEENSEKDLFSEIRSVKDYQDCKSYFLNFLANNEQLSPKALKILFKTEPCIIFLNFIVQLKEETVQKKIEKVNSNNSEEFENLKQSTNPYENYPLFDTNNKIQKDNLNMNVICDDQNLYSKQIKTEYIRAILALLKKSIELIYDYTVMSEIGKTLPNHFSYLTADIALGFSHSIDRICSAMITINQDNNYNSNNNVFGLDRIRLFEFLVELFQWYSLTETESKKEDISYYLDKIPENFWEQLIKWFFRYTEHSIFQELFFRLIYFVIFRHHKLFVEIILKKYNFLNQMIKRYNPKENIGLSSFINLLCNLIRLYSQIQKKNSLLNTYLLENNLWCNFQKQLITDTKKLLPKNSKYQPYFSSLPIPNNIKYKNNGVKVKSGYARSLGFIKNKVNEIKNEKNIKKTSKLLNSENSNGKKTPLIQKN
ncbi:hypothetical protein M0813_00457 [Anaeramoeba flamelloides]|uniref:Uncharacterized protein n=1 Tax=Anaeramoeba flamelloides TaxID=1746091 RepID=A0ABQ8YAZ7_9EUKA|nr:hypothetical protein M0813_00457 [Anaeramoeba flamelloides]